MFRTCASTWGEFPSTLAEFNLNAWNGMDFYDVSLVEGNNLPTSPPQAPRESSDDLRTDDQLAHWIEIGTGYARSLPPK